jgi:ADP-ribose pyrophosphatase YjhB (NUDIX family)
MIESKQWRIGTAGAVVHEGRVLLVRHTYGEKRGRWALPGGLTNHNERLDQTIIRDLREEIGLDSEVVDVIGLVTRYTEQGGAMHVVFRLQPLSGQPMPDGVEVDHVGWFSAGDIEALAEGEILPIARNTSLAALRGGQGLPEDQDYPEKSESNRGFLLENG